MSHYTFHIVIISWTGYQAAASHIAEALAPSGDRISVIYSNADEREETGPGTWLQLPNSAFFGPKFEAGLVATPPEAAMLLIHADTTYADWPGLLARCKAAFSRYQMLGIWAPELTSTSWTLDLVGLLPQPDAPHLVSVTHTDGVVVAFAPAVLDRLRRLDFSANNLGWGIDYTAIAFALTHNYLVLRDTGIVVEHKLGCGYDEHAAGEQADLFFAQLSMAERNQIIVLQQTVNSRHRPPDKNYLRRFKAMLKCLLGLRSASYNPLEPCDGLPPPKEGQ